MKYQKLKIAAICLVLVFSTITHGQTGGSFAITQAVIATGGTPQATDGLIIVRGTIGQGLAGTSSTGGVFATRSGFWTAPLAPTSANVSVFGRVLRGDGNPISRAFVTLTDSGGNILFSVTKVFGFYRFDQVQTGASYILNANHKEHSFTPQIITVFEDLTNLYISANPE